MKRLSLVGRVTVLAAAVALVVGVMFVAALLAILSLRRAENQETKSAATTVATLRVENLAADVGAAVRGYALSRNPRFLDLYHSARDRVPTALADLNEAVAGDAVQSRRAKDAGWISPTWPHCHRWTVGSGRTLVTPCVSRG